MYAIIVMMNGGRNKKGPEPSLIAQDVNQGMLV